MKLRKKDLKLAFQMALLSASFTVILDYVPHDGENVKETSKLLLGFLPKWIIYFLGLFLFNLVFVYTLLPVVREPYDNWKKRIFGVKSQEETQSN
ncbi:MAG: hypothetical protein JJT94_13180 [Bernardetiaceae bacterium]|nr:hypothetical protein [Bernardetiaceae bacterium]